MADLIELDIVVKDQTLKSSISTVGRLERQIIQANKAIIQGTKSQDSYNKILLSAKREYQALGMSSQKATSMVRQFAAANKAAQMSTSGGTVAINTQTVALQKNAIAGQQAKRSTNQLGVVTQQVGYQVGDFAVQVQGGQSAFVAFSQQATQLVGVLPLLSERLGVSAGKLIAISAGLGIAIPLLSALGGALFASYRASQDAGDSIESLANRLKAAREDVKGMGEDLRLMNSEFKNTTELALDDARVAAQLKLNTAMSDMVDMQAKIDAAGVDVRIYRERAAAQQEIVDAAEEELAAAISTREEYELKGSLQDGHNNAVKDMLSLQRDLRDTAWETMQAAKEDIKTQEQANALKLAENTYTKDSVQYLALIQQYEAEVLEARIKSEKISPRIADALRDALKTSQTFAQVDMGLSIRNATLDTNALIGRLSAAVRLAQIAANPILGRSDERGSQAAQTVSAGTFKAEQSLDAANKRRSDALKDSAKSAKDSAKASDKLADALEREAEALKKQADELNLSADATAKYKDEYAKLVVLKEKFNLSDDAFSKEVAKLNEELANSNPVLTGFVDAFSNFLSTGANDFKAFANDIINMFKGMLIKMIAMAAKNKIMLSMGMGGSTLASSAAASAAGNVAGGAAGGGMLGSIGAGAGLFASSVGTGMSVVGSGFAAGGLGGAATAGMGAVSGGIGAGGLAGFGTALGAVALPLLAVGVALAFFKKKTTELDSGLNVTVKNMDTLVESFSKVQTSKYFGLSKSNSTTTNAASKEVSDPIVLAVSEIQNQVVKAADTLGIASTAFKNFTYDFRLSLKGLTEEQAMAKINEELVKMGDSFASMTGLFSTVNELLAVTQQRMNLETQLLTAQGNVVELRKQELDAVHVLNKGLAARLQLLQAEADMSSALASFASGISAQQGLIKSAVDALVTPLLDAINKVKTQAEASYKIFSEAADKTKTEAQTIVDLLRGALNARTIQSEGLELMRYKQAQQQISSFAGGASFDQASLSKATQGVSVDSQKFFGSFTDYARDFYKTQISLEQLEKKASEQLTDVEKQIEIADKAYQTAMGTYEEAVDTNTALNTLLQDLASYAEVAARNQPFIDQIKSEGDRQVTLLDQILRETTIQVNSSLGIESSIADLVGSNLTAAEALQVLGLSGRELYAAVSALDNPVAQIGININNLNGTLGAALGGLGSTVSGLSGGFTGLISSNNRLLTAIGVAAAAIQESAKAAGKASSGTAAAAKATITVVSTRGGGFGGASSVTLSDGQVFSTGRGFGNSAEIRNATNDARAAVIQQGNIPGFAAGGMHSGGLRVVGENGPEIEATGPSRIYSNQQTKGLMSNSDSSDTVSELRMLRQEISEMKSEQRKIGVENVKYNKKSYDLNRQWDIVGLPATRTS
jgi:hypothetical protein